jgi:hypothetical protein
MRKGLLWTLAVLLTLASAVYQRMTGPTYPLKGAAVVDGTAIRYELPRSAETTADAEVAVPAPAPLQGWIEWKRFPTDDPWSRIELSRDGEELVGRLPRQPAAGKIAYRVSIGAGSGSATIGGDEPVVLRYKDPVPAWVLIPHVIVIFAGMLLSTAAGLTALDKKRNPRRLVLWTVGLLFLGGFILGPLMQKFAFGVAWTGFPVGTDLTDNKTLVAFLFWIVALAAGRKGRPARPFVVAASFVTLVIFLIPHSLLGSQYDYSKGMEPPGA